VTAKDKSTGKEQSIRIEATSGLTEDDIEKMKKDAEEHADEDAKKKGLIEVRNLADQMIYTAEKSLKDYGDKVDVAVKTAVEEKVTALKEVKDKDDVDAIKSATEALSNEMQKIGEAMAKDQQAQSAPEGGTEGAPQEDNVRDAEVTEEEEKKEEDK